MRVTTAQMEVEKLLSAQEVPLRLILVNSPPSPRGISSSDLCLWPLVASLWLRPAGLCRIFLGPHPFPPRQQHSLLHLSPLLWHPVPPAARDLTARPPAWDPQRLLGPSERCSAPWLILTLLTPVPESSCMHASHSSRVWLSATHGL